MLDMSWLAQEARTIHGFFESSFYILITFFLILGVLFEYFKLPLGGTPSFSILIGRVLVAAILLHTFTDVTHFLAELSDAAANQVGDLNKFQLVLDRMGDKLSQFSWSWVKLWSSLKGSIILLLSLLTFILLYFSVYVAEAFLMFTWTLCYVLSPLLIALFVLPQTAGATSGLYRSLIEISCWKVMWAIIAALLWSTGVSDLHQTNIITGICFNLILAASLLLTPIVVHQIAGGGIAAMAGNLGSIALPGIGSITAAGVIKSAAMEGKRTYNAGHNIASQFATGHATANEVMNHTPRFDVPQRKWPMRMPEKKEYEPKMGSRKKMKVFGASNKTESKDKG